MTEPIVRLQNVNKFFGENHVIRNLNLDIEEGEFLTLLGPSGCGKTTILRMIAGFEDATNGVITVQGEHVEDKEAFLFPPRSFLRSLRLSDNRQTSRPCNRCILWDCGKL